MALKPVLSLVRDPQLGSKDPQRQARRRHERREQ